jgi:two-component system response regulator
MTLALAKLDPSIPVLMADDDPDDCRLASMRCASRNWISPLHFVEDGADLLDYLKRRDRYTDPV